MSRRQLTHKQHAFLVYLRDHVRDHEVWPTYREIVAHFGYRSPNSVTQNLQALARKGYLHRSPNGYALVDESRAGQEVHVRGTFLKGTVEPGSERLSLGSLLGEITGLHAIRLHGEADRTAEFGEAHYVLVSEEDASEGGAVVVTDGVRLAVGHVDADGCVACDDETEVHEVLGSYVGHAGPYGLVRHQGALA